MTDATTVGMRNKAIWPPDRVAVAFGLALIVAWTAAWILLLVMQHFVPPLQSSDVRTLYWTLMRILLWIVPAVALIRYQGSSVAEVLGMSRWRAALQWGGGVGLALGLLSLVTKGALGLPLFSSHLSLGLLSVVLMAPFVEELVYRGVVQPGLMSRFSFAKANIITNVLFVGIHCPGWYFQGVLATNLLSPIGGALSIFLLGCIFGWVAKRSGGVLGSTIAHVLNNLFSG